jgi:hypothetical protein
MSLLEQLNSLKIHLERSLDAANSILAYIHLEVSDSEVESTDSSDYASENEEEILIPSPPILIRSNAYSNRPGTPELLGPMPKTYKKIDIDRFSPND